ncbi:MAG: TonB C-terminal domain-containing protein [Archangium sp.]|nr:TonB C-terminal domain-containing protein [Archangium sp.]
MTAAAESLLRPRPSKLVPFFMASLAGHAGLVGAALLFSWLWGAPIHALDQKPITASLVRLGKPRDEKLLPRKEEPPPPPPPAAAKPVDVPAPVPAPAAVAIPTKDAKPEPKKPADTKPAKDTKKSLFDALNKTARAAPAEELEGAADGDADGDSAKQEGERYFALLTAVVKRNYDVSSSIEEAERRRLRATVSMRIGPNGQLLDVNLSKPSGNELFDDAVVGAVKRAAPFTAPPAHLRDDLKKTGIGIEFTP